MSIHPYGSNDYALRAVGGDYVHCGEPMQKVGSDLRWLPASAFTDRAKLDALDVYLTTRVLRCQCGFQMELPA
ncbi:MULTISPECIES: hypothetical protein [unclassified Arthrobacter]|uniref:hypothetical protein n=1 Tax=unclassified Arthrobacter TaxID=235627 RepID=UPI003396651E